MPGFRQSGLVTTLRDFGTMSEERLERLLDEAVREDERHFAS